MFVVLLLTVAVAQEPTLADQYQEARELAYAGEHSAARELCQKILALKPDYHDVRILLARAYAWDKAFNYARAHLRRVLEAVPDYLDARFAMIDTEIWSGNLSSALKYANEGLRLHPNHEELLVRKAKILIAMDADAPASVVLSKVLEIDAENQEARTLYNEIREKHKRSALTLRYLYDHFADAADAWSFGWGEESRDPWQFVSLEYSRNAMFGEMILSFDYVDRYGRNGKQLEFEAYPKLRPGTYSYLGMGYSWTDLFPRFRFGAEIFQTLPHAFEISLGYRHLHFQNNPINVYTAYLGKYLTRFWAGVRTYLTPQDVSFSHTVILEMRRYLKDEHNYFLGGFQFGNSPDEVLIEEETQYLESKKFFVGGHHALLKKTYLYWRFNLENLEWRENSYLKRSTIEVALSQRF